MNQLVLERRELFLRLQNATKKLRRVAEEIVLQQRYLSFHCLQHWYEVREEQGSEGRREGKQRRRARRGGKRRERREGMRSFSWKKSSLFLVQISYDIDADDKSAASPDIRS